MITKSMVAIGLEKGIIRLADSPNGDGVIFEVGRKGNSDWFYFGSEEALEINAEEYAEKVPQEKTVEDIYDAIDELIHENHKAYWHIEEKLRGVCNKAVLKITYSWGDEEEPIECDSLDEAWEKARQMALAEAETVGEDHEEIEVPVTFYRREMRIVLQYLYDESYCEYVVEAVA